MFLLTRFATAGCQSFRQLAGRSERRPAPFLASVPKNDSFFSGCAGTHPPGGLGILPRAKARVACARVLAQSTRPPSPVACKQAKKGKREARRRTTWSPATHHVEPSDVRRVANRVRKSKIGNGTARFPRSPVTNPPRSHVPRLAVACSKLGCCFLSLVAYACNRPLVASRSLIGRTAREETT